MKKLPALSWSWLSALSWLCALLLALPLVSLAGAGLGGWLGLGDTASASADTWRHLASTVLPDYVRTSLWLCLGVSVGVALLGMGSAWLVSRCDFPGRRVMEWALVLPLAMPAYVLAYTYTDLLQFVGPVQTTLRELTGWQASDYWFPPVRSLGGAMAMFTLVLYPYVYLLTRTALVERSGRLGEVARSLGLNPWQAFWRVSLPLARPALMAGIALAMMETLADYGTVAYFGIQTFTTGIYRAWFSLGDRVAAVQLALSLLVFVIAVLALERHARRQARFDDKAAGSRPAERQRLRGPAAWLALGATLLPVLLGFLLPALRLGLMAWEDGDAQFGERGWTLARNSLLLAGSSALVAVGLALLLNYAVRLQRSLATRWAVALAGLGYALPGSVVAVGVLVPVTQLDHWLAARLQQGWGLDTGLLLTGSIAALVFACVVRYLTAAMQAVETGLGRITPHMDDAARSLGMSPAGTLWRVHAPLLRGSVLTALLLVFIDVMKELPATLVMRPFNFDTLATQVYTLAADERLSEASTPALAIVAVGLLPVILLCRQIAAGRRTQAPDGRPA